MIRVKFSTHTCYENKANPSGLRVKKCREELQTTKYQGAIYSKFKYNGDNRVCSNFHFE